MNAVHLRRFDMKRIIIFISGILCICVIVFGCGRIYSVNSAYTDDTKRYGADAVVADSGLEIRCVESHIYSVDEYKKRFGVDDVYVLDPGDRLLCVCLNVKNTGYEDMSWDDVMDRTLGGFESVTWGSAVSPYMGQSINVFRSRQLGAGAAQDIWYVTALSRVSFGQKTWDTMNSEEFWYVPALEPVKIMMKLELQE